MPTYKYLSDTAQNPADPDSIEPVISLEFPDLNMSIEQPANNPAIPAGRVLVTVTGIDGNMDRAILAIPNVSKFVP